MAPLPCLAPNASSKDFWSCARVAIPLAFYFRPHASSPQRTTGKDSRGVGVKESSLKTLVDWARGAFAIRFESKPVIIS